MTVSLDNRRKLEEAIRRMIDGKVTPLDGKLTWKNVAVMAGVSKATADRAVDLRDEFRQQLDERMPVHSVGAHVRTSARSDIEEELTRLRKENMGLKQSTKVLHSVILALVQENHRITRRHAGGPTS